MDASGLTDSIDVWSFIWQTFENASFTYDLASSCNGTKCNNLENSNIFENPAKLGIVTGLLMAWLAEFQITPAKIDHNVDSQLKNIAFMALKVTCFMLMAPFVVSLLILFFLYRGIVKLILEISIGKDFGGLLEGTDCVWAVEDSSALSVINILAVLELDSMSTTGKNVLEDFRNLVKNRLVMADFEKLCWLREKKYGYYFWKKTNNVDLEQRVRWLDDDHTECDGTCHDIYGGYLKKVVTKLSNRPLPGDHMTCWEILIGRNCFSSSSQQTQGMDKRKNEIAKEDKQLKRTIPLLFRVHHSLGDGVALLRLLLEAIADTNSSEIYGNASVSFNLEESTEQNYRNQVTPPVHIPMLRESSSLYGIYRNSSEVVHYSTDLLGASMPFPKIIPLGLMLESFREYLNTTITKIKTYRVEKIKAQTSEIFKEIVIYSIQFINRMKKTVKDFLRNLNALTSIPMCLVLQALRSMDNSAIHGPSLTGDKIISCWMEDDFQAHQGYGLLAKIRDIKHITGTRFGDVILAALSANLHNYFQQIGEAAPKTLTVVLPTRMTAPSQKLALTNRFSVGLLPLCISEVNGIRCEYRSDDPSQLLERLRDVSKSSHRLRSDPDYLVNYWVMTWLFAALPEMFLRPFLQSHSTMVFSNLPGPRTVSIHGQTLRNIIFWVPHRGTTGIGCSFLTYGGNIHLSIVADKAVIANATLLDEILKGTVRTIEQLHNNITLK